MSITTARQLVRQAEEARRAARELAFSLQNLRKQQLNTAPGPFGSSLAPLWRGFFMAF